VSSLNITSNTTPIGLLAGYYPFSQTGMEPVIRTTWT